MGTCTFCVPFVYLLSKVKSSQDTKTITVTDIEGNKKKVDIVTGEVLEGSSALSFDDDRLEAEEACDGYYCLITSEYKLSDIDIIDTYRGLWRIEESFRVTKSDLKTRPVYCSTREHIDAHFLNCYVALCVLRLLQLKTGNKYFAATIANELSAMSGTNINGNWWGFDHQQIAIPLQKIFKENALFPQVK